MKKLLYVLIILFSISSVASAKVYIDGIGAYTMAGDLDNMIGGGGAIAFDVHPRANIFVKDIYNTIRKNANKENEEHYTMNMALIGFQHFMQISYSPVYWTNAVGVGIAQGSSDVSVSFVSTSTSDNGICFAYWTGFLVEATQHISPYIEVGYHKSLFYTDFEDANVSGFQFLIGVRFTLFGKNRSIRSRY